MQQTTHSSYLDRMEEDVSQQQGQLDRPTHSKQVLERLGPVVPGAASEIIIMI